MLRMHLTATGTGMLCIGAALLIGCGENGSDGGGGSSSTSTAWGEGGDWIVVNAFDEVIAIDLEDPTHRVVRTKAEGASVTIAPSEGRLRHAMIEDGELFVLDPAHSYDWVHSGTASVRLLWAPASQRLATTNADGGTDVIDFEAAPEGVRATIGGPGAVHSVELGAWARAGD